MSDFEKWWDRYTYDWRPDISSEHLPTAQHAYEAGRKAGLEEAAVLVEGYDTCMCMEEYEISVAIRERMK